MSSARDPLVAALAQLVRERHELEQRKRREQLERRAKMRVVEGSPKWTERARALPGGVPA